MNYKQLGSISYFAIALLVLLASVIIVLWTLPRWVRWTFLNLPFILLGGILIKFTPLKQPFRWVFNRVYYFIIYQNKLFWESLYDVLLLLYPSNIWKHVNYGYAALTNDGKTIELDEEDESERFHLQLFHWTATGMNTIKKFETSTVVEISSGRGGGVFYISKYLKPAKVIGIDISTAQIEWCRQEYKKVQNLEFHYGDAEKLSELEIFQQNPVDVVISVDSAHLYPDFKKFCGEVDRILKPGGYFCITDFREVQYIEQSEKDMESFSMQIIKKQNNTSNVLHGLKLDSERRSKIVEDHVHFLLRPWLRFNSGSVGSRIYKGFQSGKFASWSYVLQKPKATAN